MPRGAKEGGAATWAEHCGVDELAPVGERDDESRHREARDAVHQGEQLVDHRVARRRATLAGVPVAAPSSDRVELVEHDDVQLVLLGRVHLGLTRAC